MFVGVRLGIPLSTARGVPILPGQLLGAIFGSCVISGILTGIPPTLLTGGTINGFASISGTLTLSASSASLGGTVSGSTTLTGTLTSAGSSVFLAMDMSDFRNTYILGL